MAVIMVSIITIYTNSAVIMTTTIVVIKKFTHCMSIATKTMTKFLKKFKKTIFVVFKMIKEHKSLIFAFPLKIEAFLLFCLVNLSVSTALPHKIP